MRSRGSRIFSTSPVRELGRGAHTQASAFDFLDDVDWERPAGQVAGEALGAVPALEHAAAEDSDWAAAGVEICNPVRQRWIAPDHELGQATAMMDAIPDGEGRERPVRDGASFSAPIEASAKKDATATAGKSILRVALLAAPLLLLALMAWQRRWTSDDGFIYLRVVR